jgi:chemotaxis protein MotB
LADAPVTVIKKVIEEGGEGHHGGAWKVAYADFVTAMMAFFLLMWLLNATTEEQRKGLADYFSLANVSQSSGGAGGMLGGKTMGAEAARISMDSSPSLDMGKGAPESASQNESEDPTSNMAAAVKNPGEEEEEQQAKREQAAFDQAAQTLRDEIGTDPGLAKLANHLLIEMTPEGLRLQLVDREAESMFAVGSTSITESGKLLLEKMAQVMAKLPNQLSIVGHTDASPFKAAKSYGNWELSSDRAHATRRLLNAFGIPENRVQTVAGKAANEPLLPSDPLAAVNRRISIVLLHDRAARTLTAKN